MEQLDKPFPLQDLKSKYQTIKLELHGGEKNEDEILVITLNRPRALNAMTMEMLEELEDVVTKLSHYRQVRVVIIRGEGKGFSAGADLAVQIGTSKSDPDSKKWDSTKLEGQEKFSTVFLGLARIPQPVIAAVHGPATGGGFSLALAADVRVVGESAKLNAAFIKIGLSGTELGSSFYLPKLIGTNHASYTLLTGDDITGEQAVTWGLASKCVPDDQLFSEAMDTAKKMTKASRLGLTLTKKQLRASIEGGGLEATMHSEDVHQLLCLNDGPTLEHLREKTLAFTGGGKKNKSSSGKSKL